MSDITDPRIDVHQYFIEIAEAVAKRSPCLSRQVGCILLDEHKHILSTGYNGPARGIEHCKVCSRTESGRDLYSCNAIHAEQNALLQCPDVNKIAVAYITINPCLICARLLANTSCKLVVFGTSYTQDSAIWFMDFWEDILHREVINLRGINSY
jgi:dCMP deaminase